MEHYLKDLKLSSLPQPEKPEPLETLFRNFIRTNYLTAQWDTYLKNNPILEPEKPEQTAEGMSAKKFLMDNLADHNASVGDGQEIYLHGERDIKCFTDILQEYASQHLSQYKTELIEKDNAYLEIFRWLLGYSDFPERKEGESAYYWRTHLREKLKEIGISSGSY